MFEKARLNLTVWYLLIIMAISILFSGVIYHFSTFELNRVLHMEKLREQGLLSPREKRTYIYDENTRSAKILISPQSTEVIQDAKNRIFLFLAAINGVIFGVSGAAGYFLAGRTLQPIKKMVDDQKRFITDASHELRTPLTSLRSEIEVSLRNKKRTAKDTERILKSNLEEVIHLQKLSDSLLELSNSTIPHTSTLLTKVVIVEVLDAAIKKLNGLIKKKEISIEKDSENVAVLGISDRLIEMFVILLDNAVKYSPAKSRVTITIKRKARKVHITVSDQGLGISQKDIPYIFDRFYRVNTKEKIDGYGLGLSIAKKIIEQHKGLISVKSETKKGTIFHIILPLHA